MLSTRPTPRRAPSRPVIAAVLLVAVGAAVAAYVLRPVPVMTPVPIVARTELPQQAAPAPVAPSFDVVRVGPQGTAVIAGRAEPGAEVILRDNGREVGSTKADSRGEFVVLPAAPLPPGGRELTLSARGAAGAAVVGDGAVLLQVPDPRAQAPSTAAPAPLQALLVPQSGSPRLLQGAPPPAPGTPTNFAAAAPKLTLDRVDYDDRGDIRFTGSAAPSAPLRVYVDNTVVGDSAADAAGRWTVTPGHAVAPGVHQVRVDHLTVAGRVLARVELPFQRAALPVAEQAADGAPVRVVVQPGQNLWRIARGAYGTGMRYTVIYLANRDQIRDPRLIYPGQAFAVPNP